MASRASAPRVLRHSDGARLLGPASREVHLCEEPPGTCRQRHDGRAGRTPHSRCERTERGAGRGDARDPSPITTTRGAVQSISRRTSSTRHPSRRRRSVLTRSVTRSSTRSRTRSSSSAARCFRRCSSHRTSGCSSCSAASSSTSSASSTSRLRSTASPCSSSSSRLPVEFDASKRAKRQLHDLGLVASNEADGVQATLNAAAWTYVAAALAAVAQLLYFLSMLNNR